MRCGDCVILKEVECVLVRRSGWRVKKCGLIKRM